MERTWDFPKDGFVKINVHAITLQQPLPNGNISGIKIVIRNHEGKLLKIVSGSVENLTARACELWAMLVGLRSAFFDKQNKIQLESDNNEVVREWLGWQWFIDDNRATLIQQLQQRKKDPTLELEVKAIEPNLNNLTRYLADDGVRNRSRLVVYKRSFGRVNELWMRDMGLGTLERRFMKIEETEFFAQQNENEVINLNLRHEDSDDEAFGL